MQMERKELLRLGELSLWEARFRVRGHDKRASFDMTLTEREGSVCMLWGRVIRQTFGARAIVR